MGTVKITIDVDITTSGEHIDCASNAARKIKELLEGVMLPKGTIQKVHNASFRYSDDSFYGYYIIYNYTFTLGTTVKKGTSSMCLERQYAGLNKERIATLHKDLENHGYGDIIITNIISLGKVIKKVEE